MALERERGKIVFTCDHCGEVEETDTRDFNEAREHIRAEGWRTEKVGDEWTHRCRTC